MSSCQCTEIITQAEYMESVQAEVSVASSDDEGDWPSIEDDVDTNQSALSCDDKSDVSQISETSKDEDSVIKVHEKRTVVNSVTPLWKCVNATKLTNECVHCLCHGCCNTESSEQNNKKRKRQCQRKADKNTSGRCNHKLGNLVVDADSSYYTAACLSKMINEEKPYPTMCSNCGHKLTNKAQ